MRELLYGLCIPLGGVLSLERIHALGRVLGGMLWWALGRRRRETIGTISERLGVSESRAAELGAHSFVHSAQAFLEIFHARAMGPRFLAERVECENPELLAAMASSTRPIVAVGSHFGCWELMVGVKILFPKKNECHIVVRLPKDRALGAAIMHMRTKPGVHILPHRDAAREALRALRGNGMAAFLVDHNCRRDEAEFLPFLGKVAAVNKGPAILALRSGAEVWPIFPVRLARGRIRLVVMPPLDTTTLVGTRQERITDICRFYTQAVERIVQRYPEQWFWMHRRWKTRPEEEGDS